MQTPLKSALLSYINLKGTLTQQIKRILHKVIGDIHRPISHPILLENAHHLHGTILENVFLIQEKFLGEGSPNKSSHTHCVFEILRRKDIVRTHARADHATEIGVFVPWQVRVDSGPSLLTCVDGSGVNDIGGKSNDRAFWSEPE
jgi:hypothetical protein